MLISTSEANNLYFNNVTEFFKNKIKYAFVLKKFEYLLCIIIAHYFKLKNCTRYVYIYIHSEGFLLIKDVLLN